MSLQDMANGHLDVKALGEAANGDENTIVTTRTGNTYPSVKKAIKTLFENGGLPATPFKTKALMTASALANDKYAMVTDDTVNNGLYVKTAGAWVKSSYDQISPYISRSDSSDILNVTDSEQVRALSQNKHGDLILPTLNNLTSTVESLLDNQYLQSGVNVDSGHLAGKYADYAIAHNAEPFLQVSDLVSREYVEGLGLFPHSVALVRVPSLVRMTDTEYLICFEVRAQGSDFGSGSVMSCVATFDPETKAVTTSNYEVLHISDQAPSGEYYYYMQPVSVRLPNGDMLCLYVRRLGQTEHKLYKRVSTDNGRTWSAVEDISYVKDELGWNMLTANSSGLIKRFGKHKGRIVFPTWTTRVGYTPVNYTSGFMYSDDNGATWELGKILDVYSSNECQCVEDINGDLIFAIRLEFLHDSIYTNKIFARYSFENDSYTLIDSKPDVIEERIMSGLCQGDNEFDLTPAKIVLSSCLRGAPRRGLGIFTSYDGAKTWKTYTVNGLENESVAYTCIKSISPELFLVIFENSNDIKSVVVSVSNLLKGD